MIDISTLPTLPQRQDSVSEQLSDLQTVANRLGMFDAADAIRQWCENMPELKYGCYCDIEDNKPHKDCVIDLGLLNDCVYAKEKMRKEQCEYWRVYHT